MKKLLLTALLATAACSAETETPEQVETPAAASAEAPAQTPETREIKTAGEAIASAAETDWLTPDPENTLYIELDTGRVVVQLTSDFAQAHVEQVKKLAREGYYDGLSFYRVIDGFVAQGGDASGEKEIKTAKKVMKAEFDEAIPADLAFMPLGYADGYAAEAGFANGFPVGLNRGENKVWLTHCTGAFAFGRNNEPDTASTEFYITLQPQRYLDRNLTVFGRVIWGMEHVQLIPRALPGNRGVIEDENRWTPIKTITVAADVPAEERTALQVLDTNSAAFRDLIVARANRSEDFFHFAHDYVGLCQMPLPVRPVEETGTDE
jgi:peptidylprolyl isomerase